MATRAAQNAAANDELVSALHERLVQTGEWDRVLEALRRGLEESGWDASLREKAFEQAKAQTRPISLLDLVEILEIEAHTSIPPAVRSEVTSMLRDFISRNVEDA
ncbi:hypothetical protein IE81DRAFT_347895 [Ceraceosorus guamensis]|uniref:Transcription and mRNA export factor SUS1 n=1 Tax=Ceraceosorus guamensis TaxID=1522189 RepID=A0A316VX07_9BASI|nr:hypothetical protein IE81DRAFT_347895 [Ceraceosorus guamensis]PWN42010.1 hypothetical protein IE81DRAFT_347895 [Ceraceosorus guamensis]